MLGTVLPLKTNDLAASQAEHIHEVEGVAEIRERLFLPCVSQPHSSGAPEKKLLTEARNA